MPPVLSISIVTYKSREHVLRCLTSIKQHQPRNPYEIFVTDNASKDGTVEAIRQHFPEVSLIVNQSNEGFARANNRAIARARGTYVLLLNPDTEVTAGALDTLVKLAQGQAQLGALAPKLVYPGGRYQPNFYRFPSLRAQLAKLLFLEKRTEARAQREALLPVDCVWGAALLFPRIIAGQVIYLDKTIFLYSEDLELCWRLARLGRARFVTSQATIIHAHNKSGEQLYGGSRANTNRLTAFKNTLRYVTRCYWRGPFKSVRFWIYCQLEATNALGRRLLLQTFFAKKYQADERVRRIAEHSAIAHVFAGAKTHTPLSRLEATLILAALALFISLAIMIATGVPRGRGNDEDSHITYVRYVADYTGLPDPLKIDFGVNREPHQPPFYYLVGAAWLRLVRPLGLGVDSLRLLAILLGLIQFWLVWLISRELLPQGWRVVPLVFFASLPMLVHEFATTNNDALSYLMVSGLTLALIRTWLHPEQTGWYVVGALAGAGAVLAKLFAAPAVLILGLALTLSARRAQRLRLWLGALLVSAIPVVWWLWHNYANTGLFVPEIHLGELPELTPYLESPNLGYWLWFVLILWQTFVGRYGSWDIVFPNYLYVLYLVPVLLGAAGFALLARRRHSVHLQRRTDLLPSLGRWIGGALLAELLMLIALNLRFFQPQARYLFSVIAGLLIVLSWGLSRSFSWKIASAVVGSLGVLSAVLTVLLFN
ncbi:MAG: glycosyltransferase [Parcubacteria group bacterium]